MCISRLSLGDLLVFNCNCCVNSGKFLSWPRKNLEGNRKSLRLKAERLKAKKRNRKNKKQQKTYTVVKITRKHTLVPKNKTYHYLYHSLSTDKVY